MRRNSQQSAASSQQSTVGSQWSVVSGQVFLLLTAYCLLLTVLAGCKKEEVVAPPVAPVKKAAPPVQAVITAERKVEYAYEPAGKRDPFRPFIELEKKAPVAVPVTPLQAYDISELRLVGVIILPDRKVAMVEDPTGKGYNVKIGTPIGRYEGRVVDILKDEVVVEEKYLDEMARIKTRRVSMRIPKEQGGEGR